MGVSAGSAEGTVSEIGKGYVERRALFCIGVSCDLIVGTARRSELAVACILEDSIGFRATARVAPTRRPEFLILCRVSCDQTFEPFQCAGTEDPGQGPEGEKDCAINKYL